MYKKLVVVAAVLLAMTVAPSVARAATISVHLTSPPVLGLQILTVRVSVTGAGTDDRFRLFLTRSGCPAEPALSGGGSVVSGDSTFDTNAVQEPPPYGGATFAGPGTYTICGYLGHPNWGPQGEPLASTVTATGTEVVTTRESVVHVAVTSASYNWRSRRLKANVTGFAEAPKDLTLWVTNPHKTCPARQPAPNAGRADLVNHKEFLKPGSSIWKARPNFPVDVSGTARRRVCVYLKVSRPGNAQALGQRVIKIVPAHRRRKR